MPIIRRKLSSQPGPQKPEIRGMNIRRAAQYLGTSSWQIRKYFRKGVLKSFMIGNKLMVDRADLDALIDMLKAAQ